MKKLIAIILTLCVILSFAACSGGETASDPSSSDPSSSAPKPLGSAIGGSDEDDADSSADGQEGGAIEYTSVAKGYIDHPTIYDGKVVNFNGYECMDDEYLFIPKGTNIMSEKNFAIFCYKLDGKDLVLDPGASQKMGLTLTPSGYSVQHTNKGTFVTVEDVYARISVRGTLQDVQLFAPKEISGQFKHFTTEELLAELSK